MSRKIRILHIISGLETGGAERALYNLLSGGLAERTDSHVVSLGDGGTIGPQIEALGIPVTSLGIRGLGTLMSGSILLRQVVRNMRPWIIQGWMYHGNLAATYARSVAPSKPLLVWNIRQSLYEIGREKQMTQHVIRANKISSSAPDVLLYNSLVSRNQHELLGFASARGQVIPNGINVDRFSFSVDSRQLVRRELGITEDSPVVGHMARFHPMKDHARFLRLAGELAIRHPDIHFVLGGKGISLQNTELIQSVPVNVRNRFHFLGERRDVSELMSAMDIFCLSSAWGEGFPNVIGEAMAVGVPCVVTDVGDSALVVGEAGIVVPPQDEGSFSAAIERLLTMPPDDYRVLSVRARSRIENNYTLDKIVDLYEALYSELNAARGTI